MKNIQTEIIINADKATIWNILTDFSKYSDWNPFIVKVEGSLAIGKYLTNTISMEGQKPQVFKPKLLEVLPQKSLKWLGSLFFKGIFDGEHYFRLEPLKNNQTRLIHGENFSGIFSSIILKMIGKQTQEGFIKMNV